MQLNLDGQKCSQSRACSVHRSRCLHLSCNSRATPGGRGPSGTPLSPSLRAEFTRDRSTERMGHHIILPVVDCFFYYFSAGASTHSPAECSVYLHFLFKSLISERRF